MIEILFCLLLFATIFSVRAGDDWRAPVDYNNSTIKKTDVKYCYFPGSEERIEYTPLDEKFEIDTKRETKVIIHDYRENYKEPWLVQMKEAFLKEGQYNVIIVNWAKAAGDFEDAAPNVKCLGQWIGELIQKSGLDIKKVHIIGFGLGAHAAGFAGKYIKSNNNNNKIARITALEPTGSKFSKVPISDKISNVDAQFIDTHHTGGAFRGRTLALGPVDFYINGGMKQPGCVGMITDRICSSKRAAFYFTESIQTKKIATRVVTKFKEDCTPYFIELKNPKQIVYGYNTDLKAKGTYVLTTNSEPPFLS